MVKDPTNYLPRNKKDYEQVKQLENLSRDEIHLLLPDLLEWIQDMNWPIATEVAVFLLKYPDEMVLLIKEILDTNDDVWKYWCLEILVKRLPSNVKKQFKAELQRIVESPTEGEKLEELDETAREILKTI